MRKITLLFALIFIISACSKEKQDTQTNLTDLKPIDAKGQKFLLKYNFKKGEDYKYILTRGFQNNVVVKSDPKNNQDIDNSEKYTLVLSTIDVDKDTVAEFNTTISAVDIDSKRNGKEIKYNSAVKMKPEDEAPFLLYAALINNSFRMRVNPKGEIIEVSHVDKIVDKFVAAQPQMKDITAEQKTQINSSVKAAIGGLFQLMFKPLPVKQTGVDSTWTIPYPPNQMGNLQVINTLNFKLKGVLDDNGSKLAQIAIELKSTTSGDKKYKQGDIEATIDNAQVTGGGEFYFNIDKGILQKSTTYSILDISQTYAPSGKVRGSIKNVVSSKTKDTATIELIK